MTQHTPSKEFIGLILLYAGTTLFNILLSGFLWKSQKSILYRSLFFLWVGTFVTFATQALLEPFGALAIILAFYFATVTTYALADILARSVGFHLPNRLFAAICAVAPLATLAAHFLGGSFLFVSAPTCFAASFPALYASSVCFSKYWNKITFSQKALAITSFALFLHCMDYPYVRDKYEISEIAFLVALMVAYAISVFAPLTISEYLAIEIERMKLEHQALEAEKKYTAVLANSARLTSLGEMAGGVAHEINTPLAVIKTQCGIAEEIATDGEVDKPALLKMLSGIDKSVDRIASIISGLRAFSRDGSVDPMSTETVGRIVNMTLDLCQEKFKQAGIDLSVEVSDPAVRIQCRSVEIAQVLLNLLNNARDAASQSQERWVKLAASAGEGGRLQVSVTDSGPGVAKSNLEKIFQPFFTTKDVGKGTGLGLSISKGIAEMHGGTLAIDTQSRYTRFVLTLPLSA